jgi:hypothetical protein
VLFDVLNHLTTVALTDKLPMSDTDYIPEPVVTGWSVTIDGYMDWPVTPDGDCGCASTWAVIDGLSIDDALQHAQSWSYTPGVNHMFVDYIAG